MNEAEWLTCTDPRLMLLLAEGRRSDRKARLFACALGRQLWPFLGDERSRRLVEVAEKYADGLATAVDFARAHTRAMEAIRGTASRIVYWVGDRSPWQAGRVMAIDILQAQHDQSAQDWSWWLAKRAPELARCVFGNPFHHTVIDRSLITTTVVALARTIYDDQAFDSMPQLADALKQAGCSDKDILGHCSRPGPHVRGCWVLDPVLGKN